MPPSAVRACIAWTAEHAVAFRARPIDRMAVSTRPDEDGFGTEARQLSVVPMRPRIHAILPGHRVALPAMNSRFTLSAMQLEGSALVR